LTSAQAPQCQLPQEGENVSVFRVIVVPVSCISYKSAIDGASVSASVVLGMQKLCTSCSNDTSTITRMCSILLR